MATKTERIETRLSPSQRKKINTAAAFVGESPSAFMVTAATEKAEEIIAASSTTFVPADYFDHLLATLDQPDPSPRLARAAKRIARRPRIE